MEKQIDIKEFPKEIQDQVLDGWKIILASNRSVVVAKEEKRKLWDVPKETFVCTWSSLFM